METPAVAKELALKVDTLNKAIRDGRLHKAKKKRLSAMGREEALTHFFYG